MAAITQPLRALRLLLAISLILGAVVVGQGAGVAGANETERSCTYTPQSPEWLVEWQIEDAKRFHIRSDAGWLATVQSPATEAHVPQTTGIFVRAKLLNGDRVDIACTEKPSLPATITASAGPVCAVRTSNFGPFLDVANTMGSINLRDEDGWVAKLDKDDPSRIVPELKDSYLIVNRNPVKGRLDSTCSIGQLEEAVAVYGGTKTAEPDLQPTNGDWSIVLRDTVNGGWAIENRVTGESRWIHTGFVEVHPSKVSADGSVFELRDSDRPLLRLEVHLDTGDGELTYYSITN